MAIFNRPTLTRLLGSIEANHLIFLCGAGLSMPAPSNLMSAVRVAEICYDKWLPTEALPAGLRGDIDGLAGHFYGTGQFKSVFISALVPWDDLVGEPNVGHAAIADLLSARAAAAALSANFDPLIEQWASLRKVAMRGALNGAEATEFASNTNPLLKFHGCLQRLRDETLWTQGQLAEAAIQQRVQNCTAWMMVNLSAKDLLIVGFWTDWGYLNDVLANAIAMHGINSVIVVDPASAADLQAKAPGLWTKLNSAGVPFEHVRASGAEALEELRIEYSKVYARKFFALGAPFIVAEGGIYDAVAVDPAGWTCDDLYNLRRDAEGTPYNRAARQKEPAAEAARAAFAHLLLVQAHATRKGCGYEHAGRSIRIVQGAGQALETVRERYNEPPSVPQPDIIICAGADPLGVPGSVISAGSGASIVRPARGGSARWLTLDQARAELAI
jgi:hypothetical protein